METQPNYEVLGPYFSTILNIWKTLSKNIGLFTYFENSFPLSVHTFLSQGNASNQTFCLWIGWLPWPVLLISYVSWNDLFFKIFFLGMTKFLIGYFVNAFTSNARKKRPASCPFVLITKAARAPFPVRNEGRPARKKDFLFVIDLSAIFCFNSDFHLPFLSNAWNGLL